MKAARALLGIDQRQLADLCAVSLPTIQRMEGSDGTVRGTIDSLVKIVEALERAGIELIGELAPSTGVGRGVRLKEVASIRDVTQFKSTGKRSHVKNAANMRRGQQKS
jgi:transcriptional regulator with XRE-family HTH domain